MAFMTKILKVKLITSNNKTNLENSLKTFVEENLGIEIKFATHKISHFEAGVYGSERTEKHYYTIWYEA